ncbi:MAG: uridine phosphorylase [Acidobacteriota bacterium]
MLNAPTHLVIPAGALDPQHGAGRLCFVPGSRARAARLASHFSDVTVHRNPLGHDVHVGTLEGPGGPVDVASVHTGMGTASVDIIVSELIFFGIRRFLRVGTAGSLQPDTVKVDDVVVATAAVRDEGASQRYAPLEFPAIASPMMVHGLTGAAERLALDRHVHSGVVHSKDSLFAREFGVGPLADQNVAYMQLMARLGVLASEMEASHLFVLAHVHTAILGLRGRSAIQAGAILAIVGDHDVARERSAAESGEARAIAIALEAARTMGSD